MPNHKPEQLTRREREIMNAALRAGQSRVGGGDPRAPDEPARAIRPCASCSRGSRRRAVPETPAGRPPLPLLGHDLAGRRQADGVAAVPADLLRRLAHADDDGPRRRGVVDRRRARRAQGRDRPRSQGKEKAVMMPLINAVIVALSSSPTAWLAAKATLIPAWASPPPGWRAGAVPPCAMRCWPPRSACCSCCRSPPSLLRRFASWCGPRRRRGDLPAARAGAVDAIRRIAPEQAHAVVPRSAGISPADLSLAAWIAGTALFLLPVVMGLWQSVCCAELRCPGGRGLRLSKAWRSMPA